MTRPPQIFDRTLLARRRARAAGTLRAREFLLQHVASDIADRIGVVVRRFPVALDLGSHHGALAEVISELPSVDMVVRTDSVPAMLAQGSGLGIVCDEEWLPFAPKSFDLVVSGLALHWVNDIPGTLVQICRSLKPDGLFVAALLGGDTLCELARAFMAAEVEYEGGASPRIGPFADVRAYGALLQRAGFAMPVADGDRVTVTYESPFALMDDLRAMGAANVLEDRARTPLRRRTLMRMAEIYCEKFADARGRVPATFDIVTLTGWAPGAGQPKPLRPGSAQRRLADALGVAERSAGEKAGFDEK